MEPEHNMAQKMMHTSASFRPVHELEEERIFGKSLCAWTQNYDLTYLYA